MTLTRRHTRSSAPDATNLKLDIANLEDLSVAALRLLWKSKFARDVPPVRSPTILRRLVACELQAAIFGGNSAATSRKLQEIAKALARDGTYEPQIRSLRTGVVLTREWKGVVHKVTVVENGFDYHGHLYKSLSVIARHITGTRWSGPRFFGLEQRSARPRRGQP